MRISDWSSDVCSSDLGVERQRPAGGDARVELAQAAGGGVARIDQRLDLALGSARLLVVLLEAGARHVDLTAHLQHARPALAAQLQRNRANRAQIGSASCRKECVSTCRSRWSAYH